MPAKYQPVDVNKNHSHTYRQLSRILSGETLEDEQSTRLGLGLVGVDEGGTDDVVGGGVIAQFARQQRHRLLVRAQLVRMNHFEGVLVENKKGMDFQFLSIA